MVTSSHRDKFIRETFFPNAMTLFQWREKMMQKGISALGMAFSIHDLTTRTLGYFVLRNKNHNMVSLWSLLLDRALISTIIIKRCRTLLLGRMINYANKSERMLKPLLKEMGYSWGQPQGEFHSFWEPYGLKTLRMAHQKGKRHKLKILILIWLYHTIIVIFFWALVFVDFIKLIILMEEN